VSSREGASDSDGGRISPKKSKPRIVAAETAFPHSAGGTLVFPQLSQSRRANASMQPKKRLTLRTLLGSIALVALILAVLRDRYLEIERRQERSPRFNQRLSEEVEGPVGNARLD